MRKLNDWLDAFMSYVANEEPPRLFQRWVGISVISACLQRKVWISRGKLKFFPNLYVILVGPSGSRKGTAMKPGMDLLEDMNVAFTPARITNAEIIRDLEKARFPIVLPDGTPYEHCSLTIFSEELTVLLRDDSDMIEVLTDWYDCGKRWDNKTKHSGCEYITNVYITLIGATTPQKLASLPQTKMEGGFLGRVLVAYARHKHHTEPEPRLTEFHVKLWPDLVHDLEQINQMMGPASVTDAWRAAYNDWYRQQDVNPPFKEDLFSGYVDRRGMMVTKLSLIMSASRNNTLVIDACDFERAVAYIEELEVDMLTAFSGVGRNKYADVQTEILAMLKQTPRISCDALMRHFSRTIGATEMLEVLRTLRQAGYITWKGDPVNGHWIEKK